MKKIFDGLGTTLLFAFSIILIACGIFAITSDSYTAGKNSVQPTVVEQTLAIVNLNTQNTELKNSIVALQSDNYALRILAQTQEEELDNLKSTVDSLNDSIANLESDNANLDEVIGKLNTDVTYLNGYISKLEDTISTIVDKYVVLVLPKEFASATKVYTYVYNDKIYFYAESVDNLHIYNLKTGTYSTAIKETGIEYDMGQDTGRSVFLNVWNDKLFFHFHYGEHMYAIDVNTDELMTIVEASFRSNTTKFVSFDDLNIVMFAVYNASTVFYNDTTKETLRINELVIIDNCYRRVDNKVYFGSGSKLACVDLDTFTYDYATFTGSCSNYPFEITEQYVLLCTDKKELKVFDKSTLQLVSTFASTFSFVNTFPRFFLIDNSWYLFNSTSISCLDISTLTLTEIPLDIILRSSGLSVKVFDRYMLFSHTSSSYAKGLYKLDFATKTVCLVDGTEEFYNLAWQCETEDKCLVKYSSSLYVYDKTAITFTLFTSNFYEIDYLTEKDDYYYFLVGKAGYGVIKIDKAFTGYEIVFKASNVSYLWKIFDDYAIISFYNMGVYIFDYTTFEFIKIYDTYFSGTVTFTLAENCEDYYISANGISYVLYYDVSERTLSLYSYNIDIA